MKQFHLIFDEANWILKLEPNEEPVAIYENLPKGDAIMKAVQHVQDMDATLTIYKADGEVAEQRQFPSTQPEPPTGEAIPMPEMQALE